IGTTVNFINSDDVLNNIFTPSWAGRKFNLGTYPKGIVRSFTFDRLGEVVILCNIHPEMEAYIFVLSNPFFAVTDKTGKFTISGVPSGKYTLKTWHERLKPQTKQISVKENSTTVVDFELIR
ncbi:MAG TPA: carboxypeptidase regulatory-like domain-containing protein, partial [Nitrospinota bacterium]|nr:carboxypeptidase regulatory-like domain-containing protein [Nitrospinota bacterium]